MNKAPRPKSAAIGGAYNKRRLLANKARADRYADDVGQRDLHDPQMYDSIKIQKSSTHFHDAKVRTCAYVSKKNGGTGQAAAIAYPLEKTGWKNPNSYQNLGKSSEI